MKLDVSWPNTSTRVGWWYVSIKSRVIEPKCGPQCVPVVRLMIFMVHGICLLNTLNLQIEWFVANNVRFSTYSRYGLSGTQ